MRAWSRKGFMSLWCEAMRADVRDLTPLVSADIVPEPIPGGVLFHLARRPFPGASSIFEWDGEVTGENEITVTPSDIPYGPLLMVPRLEAIPAEGETPAVYVPAEELTVDFSEIESDAEFYVWLELKLATLSELYVECVLGCSAGKAVSDPGADIVRFNLHRWVKSESSASLVCRTRESVALVPVLPPPRTA